MNQLNREAKVRGSEIDFYQKIIAVREAWTI